MYPLEVVGGFVTNCNHFIGLSKASYGTSSWVTANALSHLRVHGIGEDDQEKKKAKTTGMMASSSALSTTSSSSGATNRRSSLFYTDQQLLYSRQAEFYIFARYRVPRNFAQDPYFRSMFTYQMPKYPFLSPYMLDKYVESHFEAYFFVGREFVAHIFNTVAFGTPFGTFLTDAGEPLNAPMFFGEVLALSRPSSTKISLLLHLK